jgi:hypothetical protein
LCALEVGSFPFLFAWFITFFVSLYMCCYVFTSTGTAAKFSSPSGITVYYDWHTGGPGRSEHGELVLFVADTDNHRIRRIDCADPKVWSLKAA